MPEAPRSRTLGRELLGWAGLLFGIFAIQSVAARPFYIPSDSMMPVLRKGDRLVVTKFPYGYSYTAPAIQLTPPLAGRLFGALPGRGDIVTLTKRSTGDVLIKRVVGLPGDTIELDGGRLILNGRPVPRVRRPDAMIPVDANLPCGGALMAAFRVTGPDGRGYCRLRVWRETLPGGASYDTIDLGERALPGGFVSPGDDYGPQVVPAGHVFLMGDNRDVSADSRVPLAGNGLGGPVPIEDISGRAEFVTHSYSGNGSWLDPLSYVTALRAHRAGESLRP